MFRSAKLCLAALLLAAGPAAAQQPDSTPREQLTGAKAAIDRVEAALAQPSLSQDALQQQRSNLEPARSALVALLASVIGPRDASKQRLEKLGPPPKPGEPPESAEVTAARDRENTLFGDLDGVAKEAQLQIVRIDQLNNTIVERLRTDFARQIFQRSASILDPFFWATVASDLPQAVANLTQALSQIWVSFRANAGPGPIGIAVLIVLAGALACRFLRGRAVRLRNRLAARQSASRRFTATLDALLDIVHAVLGWPMAALVPLVALKVAELVPEQLLVDFGVPIVMALLVPAVFDATAVGVMAVGRPNLRLLPLSDWAVDQIHRRMRWIAFIIGADILLPSLGKVTYAPVSLTVASTGLFSVLFCIVGAELLLRLRDAPTTTESGEPIPGAQESNKLDILRPLTWLVIAAAVAGLLSGYIALANFIVILMLAALFVAALAYILMTLVDAVLTDRLATDESLGRAIASALGVSPRNVAFAATLFSGVLRLLILIAAVTTFVVPLGSYSIDFASVMEHAFFGFQVGEITISISSILLAITLFSVVMIATTLVRGWIRNTLLPRTTLDASLQNSIATMIGYTGVILASAVGLFQIGLNLQNFAIVAGALSVGIGFGLQSIVSNFVSGLILLAERPIRVGDIIAVAGEEGFVRRISVRATEIETYDRATLIIPNSQLITGSVKNWVYGNTWSRVRVSIDVGYDADVDAVRAAMLSAAEDDPRILPTPPPRVFLSKLGSAALEFELFAVVTSVETLPAVKSDLHLRILKNFRAKGIRVAAQLPAAPAPVVVSLDEALGAVGAARLRAEAAEKPG
ncbi:DUF3772 domain-containing protein [Labrys wisconsinensis]|uniref:Small-conductance mechanosensitive channel n=1 Tax=Labrys wisconsinensis TaxID=425677 RepID=A0ABU0IZQ8_9HYPH|nr:DUF3772 domain-containing protein [Labrys wisconsinensis]MDQ0467498.1 small-conductance mechanosensitive channel [Labrys wisconsinensis]